MTNYMKRDWRIILITIAALAALTWFIYSQADSTGDGPATSVIPAGFSKAVVASGLNKPRVIVFDARNRMLVSELGANQVTIFDSDPAGVLVGRTLIEKLKSPHGLAFYEDASKQKTYLYVAESQQVTRYIYNLETGTVELGSRELIAQFSDNGRHTTRTIGFGPNFRAKPIIDNYLQMETQTAQKLYISVGSSCDACVEESWKRGAILESDPPGTFTAEFAGGLRNSVFFTFHPRTGEMWATEMGRDNLGDNLPPDEINIVRVATDEHKYGARRYGWPFCYGQQVKDNKFKPNPYTRIDIPTDCQQTESAYLEIPAHSAPLGLAFITDKSWPSDWQDDLLVAYHGSWNRSEPTGYKIVRFVLDADGNPVKDAAGKPLVEDFLVGWLDGGKVSGRPVDLKFNQGSLYISDDYAGVVYRVTPQTN